MLLCILTAVATYAQQPGLQGNLQEMIAGPSKPGQYKLWLDSIKRWRIAEKARLK